MNIANICVFLWINTALAFSTAQPPASMAERPVRIVTLGDSTTFGNRMIRPYPQLLAERLVAEGIPVVVVNSGINGYTTEQGRERFETDVLSRAPDLVIIQYGLNDQTIRLYSKPDETPASVGIERFVENHLYFIRRLWDRGVPLILMTPNPMIWTQALADKYPTGALVDHPDGGNKRLEHYVEALRLLAHEQAVPLIDIYERYQDYRRPNGQGLEALFLGDGVHPNEEGYTRNVDMILPRIVEILNLKQSRERLADERVLRCIRKGRAHVLSLRGSGWHESKGYLELSRIGEPRNEIALIAIPLNLAGRNFQLQARLHLRNESEGLASILVDGSRFYLRQTETNLEILADPTAPSSGVVPVVKDTAKRNNGYLRLEMKCANGRLTFKVGGRLISAPDLVHQGVRTVAFDPGKGFIRFAELTIRLE